MSKQKISSTCGFTLVEGVVVVAVVGLLAFILLPIAGQIIERSKISRAQADIGMIAKAMQAFYEDLHKWPQMDAAGNYNVASCLMSGSTLYNSTPYGLHQDSTNNTKWMRSQYTDDDQIDLMDNHFIYNTPFSQSSNQYPTSGQQKWKGPYLSATSIDPWGRPYMIYFYRSIGAATARPLCSWVYSAGPNGMIDSDYDTIGNGELSGDDIGIRITQVNTGD